jgi:hypothetical protein
MDEPVVREDPMTGDRIWFELTEFERRFFDQPLCIMNSLLTAGKSVFFFKFKSKNKPNQKMKNSNFI